MENNVKNPGIHPWKLTCNTVENGAGNNVPYQQMGKRFAEKFGSQ
jgi:hypothetical protein